MLFRSRVVVRGTAEEHQRVSRTVGELLQAKLRTLVITLAAVELNDDLANEIAVGGQTVFSQPQDRRKLLAGIKRSHARYLLSGSDGQALCVNAGRLSNYVHSLEPVIAAGAVGFNVEKQQTLTGLSARIVAELMPEENQVGVDFALCYLRELSREQIRIESAVPENLAAAPLNLITALADQHAGTVTVPLNAPTIVAAATVPAGLLDNDADVNSRIELFYILTVRVDDRRPHDGKP